MIVVETGCSIQLDKNYKLCFNISNELANRGIVATNAPGNFVEGKVFAILVNTSREIVDILDGHPLMNIWIEEVIEWAAT